MVFYELHVVVLHPECQMSRRLRVEVPFPVEVSVAVKVVWTGQMAVMYATTVAVEVGVVEPAVKVVDVGMEVTEQVLSIDFAETKAPGSVIVKLAN